MVVVGAAVVVVAVGVVGAVNVTCGRNLVE